MPSILAASALSAPAANGQQIRIQAPVQVGFALAPGGENPAKEDPNDDGGVAVELFENQNLDRFLRRAQDMLAREDFVGAIHVLQTVIEGRTMVALDSVPAESENGKPETELPKGDNAAADKPAANPGDRPAAAKKPPRDGRNDKHKDDKDKAERERRERSGNGDPAQCVFSQNGRLYRPVRRLCQELLATLPAAGLGIYSTNYEVAAEQLLVQAQKDGTVSALEQVGNRYFVTLAAGRAMQALADRLLHDGRYRAAVQVLRDLIEVYPAENRRQLGISEVWCRFKIALALRLAGELAVAHDAAQALAARFPDESLRVMGELLTVKDLPASALFNRGDATEIAVPNQVDPGLQWLRADTEVLVPLWQFRFREPKPYAAVAQKNDNNNGLMVMGEGQVVNAAPFGHKYGTGTQLAFRGGFPAGRAVFFDNFRLRIADAFTGVMQLQGNGELELAPRRSNSPRARVPAYDFALLRGIEDDSRYYAVLGYQSKTQGSADAVLKTSDLVAYDQHTMQQVWSSKDWLDGDDGLKDVTFLAAPTVFGERLLLPALRRGAYSLQCLDRSTGRPLWCTKLHSGGTRFVKAPGTPVQVMGGIAFMLTNAGGVAAVDGFAGDLKWVRKYERREPRRSAKRSRGPRQQEMNFGNQFVEQELPTFLPSELLCTDGLLVIAPCDGEALLCLDGATGDVRWFVDGSGSNAQYGRLQYLVGANARCLYLASQTDLLCVGRQSGVRLWSKKLPTDDSLGPCRGRGCVLADYVLMPGAREVLALDAEGKQDWRRLRLPPFGVGPEPLATAASLTVAGPWLGVAYEAGIEVYSTAAALRQLAAANSDPLQQAGYLTMAGDVDAAIDRLCSWLQEAKAQPPELHTRTAAKLLNLARERALVLANAGQKDAAAGLLDRVRGFAADRTVRMNWHLARLDLWKQVQDLRAYGDEQQRLYRFMEGKD